MHAIQKVGRYCTGANIVKQGSNVQVNSPETSHGSETRHYRLQVVLPFLLNRNFQQAQKFSSLVCAVRQSLENNHNK
jgi:hypothetical protein